LIVSTAISPCKYHHDTYIDQLQSNRDTLLPVSLLSTTPATTPLFLPSPQHFIPTHPTGLSDYTCCKAHTSCFAV